MGFPRSKSISVFKSDMLWAFRHFFEDKEIFKALLGYYNQDQYRFEMKTLGERNNTLKILERNGFEYDLVEDQGVVEEAVGWGRR
jgi:hypothetical protein